MASLLTILIFLPLLGVLGMFLWPKDDHRHIGMTALGVCPADKVLVVPAGK